MASKILLAPALALSTISLGGCAQNYAVEGAGLGAAAGAGIAAVTGGNVVSYALAGAAAGGLAGYFVDKNGRCDGYDSRGYLDADCFGTAGYPVDPRR
ncbi:hypothetical protein EYB45_06715 [Erythrobacteraceae bacterium CFH 75059]|uniref:glycine zipper domain-containing protein n=1 Tax=Qipengyuania thermophila TaxID=2509361 RepID=UPI00101E92F8|nr:glycine zipper domain-containing protein [Qipengyuania thermophila]TCD05183.1 hypothetical protein EYB45_06715 [Erythrobacteraceae bacterium CFH 75059]